MDRKTWIAVGLCILGIVLWQWYYAVTYGDYLKEQELLRERAAAEAAAQAAQAPPPADPATASATPGSATAAQPSPTPLPPPSFEARTEVVSSGNLADFSFNNDTGGIETAVLLLHLGENREAIGLNQDRQMPIGALAEEPGQPVGGFEMRVDAGAKRVVFTKTESDGLEITKTFTLLPASEPDAPYVVDLAVQFKNTGTARITRRGYFLSAGAASPIHHTDMPIYTRFTYEENGDNRKIDVNWFDAGRIPLVGIETRSARATYQEPADPVSWVSVSSQYFCTILTAKSQPGNGVWATRFLTPNSNGARVYGIQGAMGLPGFDLEPGATEIREFEIYAGPKELSRLRALGTSQESVMDFGMFGFVSKFLLWGMNTLHGFLHNYAAAIIALTILIKLALWPLQNKATDSMRKMAALSPKMTELREKYKDNPTKMNEELMRLYKDYGVNPFGGCLPMLIQIPIFFGFYAMLGSAIELRNSSFLWVSDLSQPDKIASIAGFPINLLPLVMAGTMVWQMAITPKTGDKMQQRILLFMPIIFVVFAYNYASALSLYWTTQNLFSIVQLYLTRNKPLPTLEKKAPAPKPTDAANTKKRRKRRSLQ